MTDKLGDRQKGYENREAQRRTLPRLPVMIRIDGKGFSKWTKGLQYPFDPNMESLRQVVTAALIKETNAVIGYHQSDEISLVLYAKDWKSQIYADGRIQKIVSHVASIATAAWNANVPKLIPSHAGRLAYFDARVWEVPNLDEAANALMWREEDATKNSISMAARSVYSHAEVFGKNGKEMQEMLWKKGINWSDYPTWAKRGTYMGNRLGESRKLTIEEIDSLPPKHHARTNPNLLIQRTGIRVLGLPPLSTIRNKAGVLLGEDPVTDEGKE